jgi:hypothetical protein
MRRNTLRHCALRARLSICFARASRSLVQTSANFLLASRVLWADEALLIDRTERPFAQERSEATLTKIDALVSFASRCRYVRRPHAAG